MRNSVIAAALQQLLERFPALILPMSLTSGHAISTKEPPKYFIHWVRVICSSGSKDVMRSTYIRKVDGSNKSALKDKRMERDARKHLDTVTLFTTAITYISIYEGSYH